MKKTFAIVASLAAALALSASASASVSRGGHCAGFMGTYQDGKIGGHSGLHCS